MLTRWLFELDRKWKIAIAVVLVIVAALWIVRQTVFNQPSEDCKPVLDILSYNKSQAQFIDSKTDKNSNGIPTIAQETAYRAWADGLAERAQKVNRGDLAVHAVQLATLSSDFVGKLDELRIAMQGRAPGAPPPAEFYQANFVSSQIDDQIAELKKACPAEREWFKLW
ncbi:hypothetical protein ABIA30_002396 [Mycobacterium sp. MAA66]|uniref:hypothetical protein n=1 Tax=Mycobacterium sp. MAA66 TaxID=3156297 RepID=UPI00351734D9